MYLFIFEIYVYKIMEKRQGFFINYWYSIIRFCIGFLYCFCMFQISYVLIEIFLCYIVFKICMYYIVYQLLFSK